MAKKTSAKVIPAAKMVTAERAARLYRLLKLLGEKPHTRKSLTHRLHLDLRGFYRDLELLRESGIHLSLEDRLYSLPEPLKEILSRLPFPDPRLTLGEAILLSKGKSKVHKKLRDLVGQIKN
ncbi:MAG TPA: hypothetical protein VGY77_06380 [Gemmataceae bacterium]|jgi:hypothetical protein|nr:hypothetical protein [Gemmataceae bacterium]